ncbi:hypothetical protein DL239_13370 [Sedimentitalea sp. CY04]|uniref:Phospholipid methyltransferase n=1 Tax=Parasedimentitalea denitrificans TaxID=2211118 RepID=A0ABX0WCC7_9RHOB|nr:methyltransferase [Sedimentitalea sp. CY04]NIZ61965.1 hypothetical protein [Sedimentitalea sp. CY04]
MSRLNDIRAQSTWKDLIEGQPQHLGFAILLTAGAISLLVASPDSPKIFGLSSAGWAKVSIALALIHQIIVALVFRLQLHRNLLSRWLGERDMIVWRVIFIPLLIARPLSLILTAWADTAAITGIRPSEIVIGLLFLGLSIWALHSVLVHFTIRRALGGDHFRDEIAALPLVNKGVFKYTSNGMYGVAFLGLWGIALVCGSWNALVLALFQHCYIWVHMYCTESPDMGWIYGKS